MINHPPSPLGDVADEVWVGLEEFVFDWLLSADRCSIPSYLPSLSRLEISLDASSSPEDEEDEDVWKNDDM